MEKLVSVIIPMFNRELTIERSINSVLQQTYKNIEVIVVDDCSQDNSVETVKQIRDSRIKIVCLSENYGANYARNIGIEEAEGEYIAFQDSDDVWCKEKLSVQIKYMIDNELEASFTPYQIVNSTNDIVPTNYMQYVNNEALVKETLRKYNIIGTPTLVVSRNVINTVGMFDIDMPRLQDYEYAIRISKKYKIGCVPQILLYVYQEKKSISTNKENVVRAIKLLINKHSNFLNFDEFFGVTELAFDEHKKMDTEYVDYICTDNAVTNNKIYKSICKIQQDYIKASNDIHTYFIDNNLDNIENGKFAIYGAGCKGKELYQKLKMRDLIPSHFIVTKNNYSTMIDNIPIVTIEKFHDKNYKIVVAVSLEKQMEIIRTLNEYKFENVIIGCL